MQIIPVVANWTLIIALFSTSRALYPYVIYNNKKNCGQILDSDVRYGSLPQCQILPSPSNSFFDSWLLSIPATKMKVSNLFILDKLYKANPKVTPLTYGWLKYTALVNDVIAEEFRKEIGAIPIKGSALDLRIAKASKNYAKVARKIFQKKKAPMPEL